MKTNGMTNYRNFLNKSPYLLFLLILIAACSRPQTADQSIKPIQTASTTPGPESTTLPFATATQIPPTPSNTPSPTPTKLPLERIVFTWAYYRAGSETYSTISFVNSDGTNLESPELFFLFSREDDISGKYLAWSPDGRFLTFDGSDERYPCYNSTPNGCNFDNADYSEYGSFILDISQNEITQYFKGTLTNVSWAPDSQHLVLSIAKNPSSSRQIGNLFLFDVETGQTTPITTGSYSDLYPSWSPDGQRIAFVRYNPSIPGCGSFPQITLGNPRCHLASLYMMRPDGSDLQLLVDPIFIYNTSGGGMTSDAPAWSFDSQQLAFLTINQEDPNDPDVSVLNIETGESQLVAGEQGPEINPAWSSNEEVLAFAAWHKGNYDIFLWDAQNKTISNLTQTPSREYTPLWSWSGSHIAFLSDSRLWIMDANGSNRVVIDEEFRWVLGKPAWQPGVQP